MKLHPKLAYITHWLRDEKTEFLKRFPELKREKPLVIPKTFDFIYEWRDGTLNKQRRIILEVDHWMGSTVGDILDYFTSKEFHPRGYERYGTYGQEIVTFGSAVYVDIGSSGINITSSVDLILENLMNETFFKHWRVAIYPNNALVHPYPKQNAVRA